ncbi:MAG: hypothetical protein JRH20_31320 [Deltaproteobacteria bacterium]|nr:hypothetical protein [Deltaproteobacteria bacterium]
MRSTREILCVLLLVLASGCHLLAGYQEVSSLLPDGPEDQSPMLDAGADGSFGVDAGADGSFGVDAGADAYSTDATPSDGSLDPAWEVIHTPVQFALKSIWGRSALDVYVGGDSGTLLHYDGTQWRTILGPPTNDSLVEMVGFTGALVVGTSKGAIYYQDNGGSWQELRQGAKDKIDSLWAFGLTDIYAVFAAGLYKYDGLVWKEVVVSSGCEPSDLWGGQGLLYVSMKVCSSGGLWRYDGMSWAPMASGVFNALWGLSATSVLAMGQELFHLNEAALSRLGPGTDARHLWGSSPTGSSPTLVYGVGSTVQVFDGVGWSTVQAPFEPNYGGIWGSAPHLYVVGTEGKVLHYNGI